MDTWLAEGIVIRYSTSTPLFSKISNTQVASFAAYVICNKPAQQVDKATVGSFLHALQPKVSSSSSQHQTKLYSPQSIQYNQNPQKH